jgi:hypothetical protein
MEPPSAAEIVEDADAWLRTGFHLGLMLGLPGMLTIGLLADAVLRRLGATSIGTYAAVGALLAGAGAFVFVAAGGLDFGQGIDVTDYVAWTLMGAFAGGVAGAAFRFVIARGERGASTPRPEPPRAAA